MKQKRSLGEWIKSQYFRLVNYVKTRVDESGFYDAEDIVQDVIYKVISIPETIENLDGYIYQALRNRITDYYRRKDRENLSLDESVEEGETLLDILPSPTGEVSEGLIRREMEKALFEAIEKLPEDLKTVLIATEMDGLGYDELSVLWGEPPGTLMSRKHRAMQTLKKALSGLKG
jgi:RNA polymerase sigma-70 factor (ECF subfamily)